MLCTYDISIAKRCKNCEADCHKLIINMNELNVVGENCTKRLV